MIDISTLDIGELRALNRAVIERINILNRVSLDGFKIGEAVSFNARGDEITGIVLKINKKSVSVRTSKGTWRVSPSLLSRVEPGTPIPEVLPRTMEISGLHIPLPHKPTPAPAPETHATAPFVPKAPTTPAAPAHVPSAPGAGAW